MSLNNTYFESNKIYEPLPIPETPGYIPPSPPTPPTPGSGSEPVIPRPSFSGNIPVVIYNNSSENNAVNKNLASVYSCTITVKDELSIFTPSFDITTSTDLTGCNYAKVGDRYYFARITLLSGDLYRIECNCDRLMTFADQLKLQTGLIGRNLNQYNRFLPDNRVKLNSYESVKTLEFSGGFSKDLKYYLIAIGGDNN